MAVASVTREKSHMTNFAISERNTEQIAFWNGAAGEQWTRRQAIQDMMLAPVSAALAAAAAARPGEVVIDVGCGCGSTTLELGRAVGATGRVLGVDVSADMLAHARTRLASEPVSFLQADATVHDFELAKADLLFSRFGVMFFAEPIPSFANMRRGLKSSARVAFACWQEPKKNPWMIAPLMAAYKHVPRLPQVGPEEPGPFAFADEARVQRILSGAGFTRVVLTPHTLSFDISAGRGLDAAVTSAIDFGPTGRAIEGQTEAVVGAVRTSIREALAPHVRDGGVHLPAAIWIVTAQV
jgi:ubiquinone/menaquinone biosynthesis C-methylase UbiE